MKVLVLCEFSGVVREAFTARGHDAWSCDLLPSEIPGNHFERDAFDHRGQWALPHNFDLIVAHPPCTHLCVSGARWFLDKQQEQREAIAFFMRCINAPAPKIAVENPVGIMSTRYKRPDQIIHPWMFGDAVNKKTCLWLENLPPLIATNVIEPWRRRNSIHEAAPGPDRWRIRSRTFQGIADAMAAQWG